jgi:membrane protease YdiL (CAAX protease family)
VKLREHSFREHLARSVGAAALAALTLGALGAPAAAADLESCGLYALLLPGAGPICAGHVAEGVAVAGLAAAEIAGAIAARAAYGPPGTASEDQPIFLDGRVIPLVALQNTWAYSIGAVTFDLQRAQGLDRVPPERLAALAAAPFDPRVLRRPAVWAGTLGLLAGGAALSFAVEVPLSSYEPGLDPNLFGRSVSPGTGAALYGASSALLFEHVAIGEEVIFRGIIQSGFSRRWGDAAGFWLGTATFGALHAANLPLVPPEDRLVYAAAGLPWITLAGAWLGATYRWADFELAGPVAIHFWYDVGISTLGYLADPAHNIFSIQVGGDL